MPYAGAGAPLRGTCRRRPPRRPNSMPDSTRGRLERAVPRQLQRLPGQPAVPAVVIGSPPARGERIEKFLGSSALEGQDASPGRISPLKEEHAISHTSLRSSHHRRGGTQLDPVLVPLLEPKRERLRPASFEGSVGVANRVAIERVDDTVACYTALPSANGRSRRGSAPESSSSRFVSRGVLGPAGIRQSDLRADLDRRSDVRLSSELRTEDRQG